MIELLVSISVFAVVVAIVSGIFIASLRSNRTSVALISANSDGQLAMEQMTRMIRKGKNFILDEVDTNNEHKLEIIYKCLQFNYGEDEKFITYRWNKKGKKLEVSIVDNNPLNCNDSGGGGIKVFNEIISENLRVDFANFRIIGQGNSYPLITIVLRVGAKKTLVTSGGQAFINLQTSVSSRSDGRY